MSCTGRQELIIQNHQMFKLFMNLHLSLLKEPTYNIKGKVLNFENFHQIQMYEATAVPVYI